MDAPVVDYPAAHSMDTEWFAVDAHGRVGRFDTGEDGALPQSAAVGMGPGDSNFDARLLSVARLAHVLGGGEDDPYEDYREPPAVVGGRLVLVVDPPSSYRHEPEPLASVVDLIDSDEFHVIRARSPVVLLSTGELTDERARDLSARKGVRWVLHVAAVQELMWDRENDGLTRFWHDHGEDPGLYRRAQGGPAEPLTVDDLDPTTRGALESLVLPVDFANDPQVHLADHEDTLFAETWGDLPLRYGEDPPSRRAGPTAGPTAGPVRRQGQVILFGFIAFIVFLLVLVLRGLWPR